MDAAPAPAAPPLIDAPALDRWPWRRAAQALAAGLPPVPDTGDGQDFEYRGCRFVCAADEVAPGRFVPRVLYRADAASRDGIAIALDAAGFASRAEALRAARREAAHWVDRHQILPPLRH